MSNNKEKTADIAFWLSGIVIRSLNNSESV
jgi:hypothetical protein